MYIRLHCLPQQCVLFVRSLKFLDWSKTSCQPWNAESREKIKLGRAWQNAAGSQYRYYMVFQNKDLHLEGAYRFDEFLKILGELVNKKKSDSVLV